MIFNTRDHGTNEPVGGAGLLGRWRTELGASDGCGSNQSDARDGERIERKGLVASD